MKAGWPMQLKRRLELETSWFAKSVASVLQYDLQLRLSMSSSLFVFVCLQEEDLYVNLDTSEKFINEAANDPKLYDTFHEILHESLQFESSS